MKHQFARRYKKFIAPLALVATAGMAHADPVSISGLVTGVTAQASSVITEALPFLTVVLGGVILFKMIKKFVR